VLWFVTQLPAIRLFTVDTAP